MRGWNKLLILCLAIASIVGCSSEKVEKGVIVKGSVNQGGQVLRPSGSQAPGASKVEVIFYPNDPNGVAEQGVADPNTGEFSLVGAGRGIRPGTYKVGVFVRGAGWDSDDLQGKFNQQNTPITVTIPADKVGGTHDLGAIDINNPPQG
jgi:hypothetical protein